MKIGIITGSQVGKNRDGDVDRVLLQVQTMEDDVRTLELFTQHGEDVVPAKGCRVIIFDITEAYQGVIAASDDLTPEVDPGEKEIYSTDDPVSAKQARTKWDAAGNVIHNQGTESVVTYAALDLALQGLILAINGALATKADAAGAAGALTLDISGAESPTVKVP